MNSLCNHRRHGSGASVAAVAVSCLSMLVGCKVGPDYQRQELPVEPTFGGPTTLPASSASAQEWWRTLNDAMLDRLVDRARKSSLDVKLAAARVQEARAYRQVAGAQQYPQLGIGANYSHQRLSKNAAPFNAIPGTDFPWAFDTYSLGFDASWETDLFGGIRRNVEAADADVHAAVDAQRGVLLSTIGEVCRAYVELRGYQQALAIAQSNLDLQRQVLDLVKDRRRNGVGSELDVAQSQALYSTTQAVIPQLRTLQHQAIHRIAILLGEDIEPLMSELTPAGQVPGGPQDVPVGIPADLLRRRPDIRRAERNLAAATARIGSSRADLYPKLNIGGNFGLSGSDGGEVFNRSSRNYSVGPGISWPIFDGGRIRGMITLRNAQQEQALIGYEASVRRSIGEVRDALVAYAQERERRQSLVQAEKATADSVAMSREMYEKGLVDLLNVLDAQRSLLQVQDALVRSRLTETTSLVALYKALGGGWEGDLPETPATQPKK